MVPKAGDDRKRAEPAELSPHRPKAGSHKSPIIPGSERYDVWRRTPRPYAGRIAVELNWVREAIARAEGDSENTVSWIEIGLGQRTYRQVHSVGKYVTKE